MTGACNLLLVLLLCVQGILADDSCPGLPKCFCNKAKTSVNCEGKRFATIPENIPPTAEKLYLGYNKITVINTNAFLSLPQLQKLWLKNNHISSIQPYAFRNLSQLTDLDLQNNKLTKIVGNAFSGMERLSELYLMSNKIGSVNESAFDGTESLTYISMQANALVTIPPLGCMPRLERLILQGNHIENATFPWSFNTSKHLSYIGLSSNKIKWLTNETFESLANNSLSSLHLSRNNINSIGSETFKKLRSVASLKLGTNLMDNAALQVALGGLHGKEMVSLHLSDLRLTSHLLQDTFSLLRNTSITTLSLRRNKTPILPDFAFSGLNKLLHLDLSDCGILETNQNSFAGLDNLTILNLQNNKLMDVPRDLPRFLTFLYLDFNQIHTIHNYAFENLAYLQELRIRYNKLQTLHKGSFVGLVSLKKLSLHNNYIATLPGKTFSPLVRLTSLELSKNNLASIQNATRRFSNMGLLVHFSIADNKCSYFQPDLFANMASLKYLHLENNVLGSLIANDKEGLIFKGLNQLEELHLMHNGISNIPDAALQELSSLYLLNISFNQLSGWGDDLFKKPQKLKTLDLTHNLVATVKEKSIESFYAIEELNLTNNPFTCNCDLRWFRNWMNKTTVRVTNNESYTCNSPSDWAGKRLLSFDGTKIDCSHITWYILGMTCVAIITLYSIFGGVLYRKRWWIMLYFHKKLHGKKAKKPVNADQDDDEKIYDAYISYADEDERWVRDYLLPDIDKGELDGNHMFGGEFSLYYYDRDSQPGCSKFIIIDESISASRKVIVVLSRHYLDDAFKNGFELEVAIDQLFENLIQEIIVIHIDKGLPGHRMPRILANTMRRHKMLEWAEDEEAQQLFKTQLKERLKARDQTVGIAAD